MLQEYRAHVEERATQGIPPLPLSPEQVTALVALLEGAPAADAQQARALLLERVPAGVDEAAQVKAQFLAEVASGKRTSGVFSREEAVGALGAMLGGYNVAPLIELLDEPALAASAARELKHTLLVFGAFADVQRRAQEGNAAAVELLRSWAEAEWFTSRPDVPEELVLRVFKVTGETNTDDLSPATEAWSRPDIPLHALSIYKNPRPGVERGAAQLAELRAQGTPIAFVGDVVGTGSSRKSATNSVLWYIGQDVPGVPNKRAGGVILGGKIAPIFFNTLEDSGALPIECDVSRFEMGQLIRVRPYEGKVLSESGENLASFQLKTDVLLDEVRAGGRIPLIIGRDLTKRARESLGLPPSTVFRQLPSVPDTGKGYTLAQKMVGRACGLPGVRPGSYCEPVMATVGSQDTTGPMTRDELKDLACLKFSADIVMQSFCHTAAYPKPVDVKTHATLPDFIRGRGGVSLRPGDGIIHSWLNRMLLPDTVGTGGDSHTRFPLGISFPAGSGLVAFAAALGVMPLDMPESVLVRFKGTMQPGITLRDLVNAIPYVAIQRGLLTVDKAGKKNVFNGRILEIEGLPNLKVEQAFELSDASAERSAAGCTIRLSPEPVIEYLRSNATLLRWMTAHGYGDAQALQRRADAMDEWLKAPQLLEPDADAEYAEVIEIDMSEIREPILACPNDPDDVRLLSSVAGDKVDEVFLGSCMTNIGHFRAAAELLRQAKEQSKSRLWVAPPTRMDEDKLVAEGMYADFAQAGARTEVPGCSLCMGNQARVLSGATVVSTSTRNFPNRMGKDARVYLSSAEVAAITSLLGRLPTVAEYQEYMVVLEKNADRIYQYLNFDQVEAYAAAAARVKHPLPVVA